MATPDKMDKPFDLGSTDGLEELQTITLKGKYPLALALANLPQSQGW